MGVSVTLKKLEAEHGQVKLSKFASIFASNKALLIISKSEQSGKQISQPSIRRLLNTYSNYFPLTIY